MNIIRCVYAGPEQGYRCNTPMNCENCKSLQQAARNYEESLMQKCSQCNEKVKKGKEFQVMFGGNTYICCSVACVNSCTKKRIHAIRSQASL